MNFEIAGKYFDSMEFDEATKYYQLEIEENPLNYEAIMNIALCFYELGEYDKSIVASNQILKVCSDYLVKEAFINRGNCFHATLQFEKAVEDFSSVIAIDDECASAYFNRANAYSKLGKIEEAKNDRETVRELEPTSELSSYYKAPHSSEMSDKQLDQFISDIKKAKDQNPHNLALKFFEEGNAYVKIRVFDKACILFQKAIDAYPGAFYEAAQLNLINALYDLEESKELILSHINFYMTHNSDNEIINSLKLELENGSD